MSDDYRIIDLSPDAILARIIRDIRSRNGLGDAWNEIDVDVRNEIIRKGGEDSSVTNPDPALTEYEAELERARKEMTGDTEQQAPEEPYPDEDGHCIRCGLLWEEDELSGATLHLCPPGFLTPIARQQAPGLDWDAASRKMIEQAQEERGTPHYPYAEHDHGVVLTQPSSGTFERRPMTPGELAARYPALTIAQDIYRHANYAGVCYIELWELIAKVIDAELASSQHGYKLLAAELADTRSLLVAAEQNLLRARQDQEGEARAAAAWADSAEKQAAEIAMGRAAERKYQDNIIELAAEIAALKQRLEQSEKDALSASRSRLLGAGMFGLLSEVSGKGFDVDNDLRDRVRQGLNDYEHMLRAALAAEPPGGQQEQLK